VTRPTKRRRRTQLASSHSTSRASTKPIRAARGRREVLKVLARAEALLVTKPRYPSVIGVGVGRRRRQRGWTSERVITVFVATKRPAGQLPARQRIPAVIAVSLPDRIIRLPTDVIAMGAGRGRAQLLAAGDEVETSLTTGRVSWVSDTLAVTAEHVTGFASQGSVVTSNNQPIGRVARLGYQINKVDAALIELEAGVVTSQVVAGRKLGRPRYATDTDIFDPAKQNSVFVYLPATDTLTPVALRHVHVGPYFTLTGPDGTQFTPRPLAMTDICTHGGDSGTVLLGADYRPIALLSGVVEAADGQSYSCFTELGPALDTLQVDW
jgi:hypothetical protein